MKQVTNTPPTPKKLHSKGGLEIREWESYILKPRET